MSALERLARIDRRWLFVGMGILVLVPLLFPLHMPIHPTRGSIAFHRVIESIPDGSTVLMACDYDPGTIPEMVPMTRTAMRQLWDKHCKVVITVLWPGGPGLVDRIIAEVAAEYPDKKYGVDWVNLGYKPGNEAVMVLMGQGIKTAFPYDYRGNATRSLPIMDRARDYSDFPLLISISSGYPGTKEWVQQVQARFHLPMVAGVTAVSAPEFYPYVQSGQLLGMLGGMAGAAEYEQLRNESGEASRGMDAQSLAHVFVALCILLGNLVHRSVRKGSGT
jgi:hypothetical protein